MEINEKSIPQLRVRLEGTMSEKRYRHTLEVEKMAARLAALYAPEKEATLRVAALLHDITKEYSAEKQIEICEKHGFEVDWQMRSAPKTLHAVTAALCVPELYPEFCDDEIISCIRWHTTGRENMGLLEALVYLADYIDMSRSFEDCVRLREYFWSAEPEKMSREDRVEHLRKTLILSFDMTVSALLDDGKIVSRDTFEARNSLIFKGL